MQRMKTNAVDYVNVQKNNCRNLRSNVHPRLEVVVRIPNEEARSRPVFPLDHLLDLRGLKNLLDT